MSRSFGGSHQDVNGPFTRLFLLRPVVGLLFLRGNRCRTSTSITEVTQCNTTQYTYGVRMIKRYLQARYKPPTNALKTIGRPPGEEEPTGHTHTHAPAAVDRRNEDPQGPAKHVFRESDSPAMVLPRLDTHLGVRNGLRENTRSTYLRTSIARLGHIVHLLVSCRVSGLVSRTQSCLADSRWTDRSFVVPRISHPLLPE